MKIKLKKNDSTWKYIPTEYSETISKADLPIFEIKELSFHEEAVIKDSLYLNGSIAPYHQYSVAYDLGVVGIHNVFDESTGIKIEFSEELKYSVPGQMRDSVALEIIKKIRGENLIKSVAGMELEEVKN